MKKIHYLILCCLVGLLASCDKDTDAVNFAPDVTTGGATDIFRKGATLSGKIQFAGESSAQDYGILVSEYPSMAEPTEYPITTGETDYKVQVQNLSPDKTYYYCAYANSGYSTARGDVNSFQTTESNVPVFGEVMVDSIGWGSVRVTVSVLDDGGVTPIISGFCWREGNSGVPTLIDNVVNIPNASGNTLTAVITGLTPQTNYVIAAYSVNSKGMGFSQGTSVQTEKGPGIYSLEDLVAFRDARNASEDVSRWKTSDGIINVFADIDLSPIENWEPISQILEDEVFDGNNHTIKGLNIDFLLPADDESVFIEHLGFILQNQGTVRNLTMGEGRIDIELQRNDLYSWGISAAGIVAINRGRILNCKNEVDVIEVLFDPKFTTTSVSGIAGQTLQGIVENCVNYGDIQGSFSVNGICGSYFSDDGFVVRECLNYGTLTFVNETAQNGEGVSGISSCLNNLIKIENCVNYGFINGGQVNWAGGISSSVQGVVDNCVNEGRITTTSSHGIIGGIGGIAGRIEENGTISNCTNKGEIETPAWFVGGIVGDVNSEPYNYFNNENSGTVNGVIGSNENAKGIKY